MGMTLPGLREWVKDFSPGLMDAPESDRLPLGGTTDASNADFDKVDMRNRTATMKKRAGSRLLTPTSVAVGKKWDGLFEFRRASMTPKLLGVCNGALYQFDDLETMTAVGGGTGFTPGNPARASFFRSNAIIVDGAQNKRYNGTTVFDLGFAKPSSATDMTVVAPSGTGVTGTYESYYVWYDEVMDHESSPSATTAPVVFTADARRHTKPGGSPPVNVTHWRAYVRRTDTNEFNFFRTATVLVATATFDEEVSDTARREAGLGPFSSDNDPPPGAFAILSTVKAGLGIGVLAADDSFYVSKPGDLESWPPRNKFPVNRGDGEAITSVLPFGTDTLVQKGHATWRLEGDKVPFVIRNLHSKWGNVSQESGLEVDGQFYGWDRENGPYKTDTVNWDSLVFGICSNQLAMVNRLYLSDIRAVYDETAHVIKWAVPLLGSARKRMVMKFHVGLQTWLPPDTGLEYGSLCTFTDVSGALGVYMGDYWGRIFQLGYGLREGVSPTSVGVTAVGPIAVTSATASSVTCTGAAFYTGGSGLAGLPVAVVSDAGVWQWRRIESNTIDAITLDTTNDNPWTTTPDTTYFVIVGGLRWYWTTPVLDFGIPEIEKKMAVFYLQAKATSSANAVTVGVRYVESEGATEDTSFTFPVGDTAGVWGSMVWGVGRWSTTNRRTRKMELGVTKFGAQFLFSNFYADQPVSVTAYGLTADAVPGRKASGYAER
jgi:hypothetical protein